MPSILFVCLGNICRSPAAEGILRHLVEKGGGKQTLHIKSCGMGNWHVGQLPDERMREAAKRRGITLSSRAQAIHPDFLDQFDYVLAADQEVLHALYRYTGDLRQMAKMHLITEFSVTYRGQDIPDPFYQGDAGFELVLDMLEDSCEGFLQYLASVK